MIKFTILTIFPEISNFFNYSILKRAQKEKKIKIEVINLRDFSDNKHKKVDDVPYSGDKGMLFTCPPIFNALEKITKNSKKPYKIIFFSPRGKILTQKKLVKFSQSKIKEYIIICGHYEGIDQRIIDYWVDEEISIGKFILTGGEIPTHLFVDGLTRLLPNVLGSSGSLVNESFSENLDNKKEYPQYTRPKEFKGLKVPDVLFSGDHKKIEIWKKNNLR
jgi:tRNA (guanine37-N1)-methyltransferase